VRPPFVDAVAGPLGPEVRRVRTFFMDEARFGQQGTLANVWARRGSRPAVVRQTKYEWCYLYAAVEPATGASAALVAPNVNTGTMNRFLEILAAERQPDEHIVLILDQAGWHQAKDLVIPLGISFLFLPPYSPELNPVENLWHYLRDHYLSNRSYTGYEALVQASTDAYRRLTPAVLKTVCGCPYLQGQTRTL
jgi:transposase